MAKKKKSWKNGHFWRKTIGQPLWKNVSFSSFWTCCFYIIEKRFFVLEYRKGHFPGLYCLKKEVGKMALFLPKPWVNPFGKMSIFRLFELFVFIVRKGFFSIKNIVKHIFLAYIAYIFLKEERDLELMTLLLSELKNSGPWKKQARTSYCCSTIR